MSKDIDYNKKNGYRYTSAKSKSDNYMHTKDLSSKPTREMIRFNKFLVKLCKENGMSSEEVLLQVAKTAAGFLGKHMEQ